MKLLKSMKQGKVYRRKDLNAYSSSVDRDLSKLTSLGLVSKLAAGLYVKPEKSRFGDLPPEDRELARAYLDNAPFLLMSFNYYNSLGLGLTQLRDETLVYNRKRHKKAILGSKKFVFKNVPEFPRKLSKEFLLVDLLNNLKNIGESPQDILRTLEQKKDEFDSKKVVAMALKYGKVKTKSYLRKLYG